MSQWGSIDATFVSDGHGLPNADTMRQEFEERGRDIPTGSEGGPSVLESAEDDGAIWVEGRLRDVNDREDAAMILAWFVRHAQWCERASITFDFDSGPRYRYEWKDGTLTKLTGVLDA